MPNQRGCAARALGGSIRYAPLLVGWGVTRLRPEGCRPASSHRVLRRRRCGAVARPKREGTMHKLESQR